MQGPGGGLDPNSSYFISQVQKLSGGRIQIVPQEKYSTIDIRNEPRLVRALRSGKVEMAYIASRAWEAASPVTAFRALQAPLLVTSYPLLRRITTGPIGHSMLASLNSIGIVGLGLVPERLRRVLGSTQLDSAATLRGARIRPASPTDETALRALGMVPVLITNSQKAGPALGHHEIDGVESDTISIENNNYMDYAHWLTANLALFAKTTTIAIGKPVFDHLSPGDRNILRAAAKATVARADPAHFERLDAKELCSQGVKLVTATPDDLASLERLAPPADVALDQDPTTRREIQAIERLKKALSVPVSAIPPCPAKSSSRSGSKQAGSRRSPLDGTYVMTASLAEINNGPPGTQNPGNNYGSFRFFFHDGRFRISDSRPAGELVQGSGGQDFSSGWSAGTYAIKGDQITFTTLSAAGDAPMGARGGAPVVCRWNSYHDELTFQQLPAAAKARATELGLDPVGPPLLYVRQWRPQAPTQAPAFPTGRFETKITPADVARVGGPSWWAHWETLTYTKNGTFTDVWFHPRRADQPTTRGRYRIHGNRLYTFGHGRTDVFRWSYYRSQLTLKIVNAPDLDPLGHLIVNTHPWRKIS